MIRRFIIYSLLSLLPLALVTGIGWRQGQAALRDHLGLVLHKRAAVALTNLDRELYFLHRTTQSWATLELVKKGVLSDDVDLEIQTLLHAKDVEYPNLISAAVADGDGQTLARFPIDGDAVVGAEQVHLVLSSARWQMEDLTAGPSGAPRSVAFMSPVGDLFEDDVVGVVRTEWRVDEFLDTLQAANEIASVAPRHLQLFVLRGDGFVVSPPVAEEYAAFDAETIVAGIDFNHWTTSFIADYSESTLADGRGVMVGYSCTSRYEELTGLGWCTAVVLDKDAIAGFPMFAVIKSWTRGIAILGVAILIFLSFLLARRTPPAASAPASEAAV